MSTKVSYQVDEPCALARWACWPAVCGLLGCMAVSAPMWWTRADFPLLPWWGALEPIAPLVSQILLVAFVFLVCIGVVWQRAGWWLGGAGLCVVGLMVLDLMRFQPWAMHLASLLLLWGLLQPLSKRIRADSYLWFSRWILILIYFWSGWHKCQPLFGKNSLFVVFSVFPSTWQLYLVEQWGVLLGFVAAALEMLFAVLLIFPRSRRWGVVLLTLMHLNVIISLLLLKHDYNVIPWNIACLGFLWGLFWGRRDILWRLPVVSVSTWRYWLVWGMFALFAVFPVLHSLDRWDPNLSFALYSGNYVRARLFVPVSLRARFPASMQPYLTVTAYFTKPTKTSPPRLLSQVPDAMSQASGRYDMFVEVDLYQWSTRRFWTTAPPSLVFYRTALRALCRRFPEAKARLVWRAMFTWFRKQRPIVIETCPNLPTSL